jgi:WD40 repeat protein
METDYGNELNELYTHILPVMSSGISQELLTDNHKSIGTELICAICLETVFDPVMCSNCENLFCKPCIDRLLVKSTKCPNQCLFIEKEKNIMLKKLLNKIEFKCLYNKKGCGVIIPYSEFVKHICSCEYGNFKCAAVGCTVIDIKDNMLTHIESCPYRLFQCTYCELRFARKDFYEHVDHCGNLSKECQYCHGQVLRKNYAEHINLCDYFEITCEDCLSFIKRIEYAVHDKVQCLELQVKYWKLKFENADSVNKEYEARVKELEKSNCLSTSTKMLDNNPNNTGVSNLYDFMLENFGESAVEDNSGDGVINKYTTNSVKTLQGLSGLVYSIVDLHVFKANLAACGNFSSILLFNSSTCEKVSTLEGHTSYIWSLLHLVKYNPSYLASGSQDNTIRIWDLSNKTCITVLSGHSNWVTTVCTLASRSNYLLSASYDHTLRIWDISSGGCVKQINNIFGKSCLNAFHVKESLLLHGASGNNIQVFDYDTDSVKYTLKGHTNLINCFVNLGEFNPNLIASGSDDRTIKLWNLTTGGLVKTLLGHNQCITFLTHIYKFDKAILMSGSDDHTIRLWNLNSLDCHAVLKLHASWVKSILPLANNPDYFLSHGDTGIVKLSKLEKIK